MMDPSDLYGLPLERFTDERNALAKQLRQAGRRDEASEAAKLRKPSVAAWAVNQLVRTQKRDMELLLEAGDDLVGAQANVLGGRGDPGSLRRALEAEREAVDGLVDRARGLLSAVGAELSTQRLEQVRETLHAAALDGDARDQVRSGCLIRELRHVGLGTLGGERAAPVKQGRKRRAAETRATRGQATKAQRRQRARGRLRDAEKALAAANEARVQAAREHERAQQALDRAAREHERAQQAIDKATRERDRAQQALDDLG